MSETDILIAEDDPLLREVYRKKFSVAGFPVRTVQDGQACLQAVAEKQPEMLLLDIGMPIVDGMSVLQQLPREHRSFPIIMLSNFMDDMHRERARTLGADAYLIKSQMTVRTLLQTVRSLEAARRMWQPPTGDASSH